MTTKQMVREGLPAGLPPVVKATIREMLDDETMSVGMGMMAERVMDFASPAAALFAGLGINPASRAVIEQVLDNAWDVNGAALARTIVEGDEVPLVVIGSGVQSAIFCAAWTAAGGARPIVLEQNERAGGQFAVSRQPSFYLNSRNRPGDADVPGSDGQLNALPGSFVQPSDLGGDEYQSNDQLAWAVRTTLAATASVVTGVSVGTVYPERYDDTQGRFIPELEVLIDGEVFTLRAGRCVIASGLGEPDYAPAYASMWQNSPRLLTYNDFMRRFDEPFPLAGLGKVAVVGAGDSGRTVVEALHGQGPNQGMSVMSLDRPDVTWFGVPQRCRTREGWEQNNRSRYKGIGRLLPSSGVERDVYDEDGDYINTITTPAREGVVRVSDRRAEEIVPGYEKVIVNGEPFDTVVLATGFIQRGGSDLVADGYTAPLSYAARQLGVTWNGSSQITSFGPAANLPLQPNERSAGVPENSAAIFRYADRTALAAQLMATEVI